MEQKPQDLKNLLVVKAITVYNDQGLKCLLIKVGATIKGKYDGFLGGYRCFTDEGFEFMAFYEEVILC